VPHIPPSEIIEPQRRGHTGLMIYNSGRFEKLVSFFIDRLKRGFSIEKDRSKSRFLEFGSTRS
jgi:hypothetical protein